MYIVAVVIPEIPVLCSLLADVNMMAALLLVNMPVLPDFQRGILNFWPHKIALGTVI